MLDLIILILLFVGLVTGAKRGLIVQLMYVVSLIVALIVAYVYYESLAQKLLFWVPYPGVVDGGSLGVIIDNLDLDRTFYQVIAFAVIFFAVKIILQIITSVFDFIAYLPVLKTMNRWLGALFGIVEYFFILFIVLYVLALLPIDTIQNMMAKSLLSSLILEHTPIITKMFQNWWYIYAQ
ncbi:CvpA family protein [Lysinibacillus piscis]|uniref:Colicin V production protein CvpA n=1 Tax=Lysinibacillus piscis TaxID=2518931 RepID=A0ABQ5NK00_9BACI|nr:CvpA family protein [Lysinibacillus sp. KH24]GLC88354.1 colicin V production protein CvpA [Lysinibacillus sp. KH24]